MKILIMGAPGSGKGTQAEIISEKYNIPTISSGSILREAIAEGTEIGKIASMYINDGLFVPDDVMIKAVMERLEKEDCENGCILDGFPRTLEQVEAMERADIDIDFVLKINLADEEIIKRVSGRRVCEMCGATFHVIYKPTEQPEKCDVCGAKLVIRQDDREEVVKNRLKIYYDQTVPVINYYEKKGKIVESESMEEISETAQNVSEAIAGALCNGKH